MKFQRALSTACGAILACAVTSAAFAADCGNVSSSPRKITTGVVFATSLLNVDADGAPNSYRVDGKGLSYTCDGVTAVGSTPKSDPDHWQQKCRAAWAKAVATKDYSGVRIFGFAKDAHGVPVVQTDGDALPKDAFVSETRVPVPDGPVGTQRHWVDATKIPYVVLTSSFVAKYHVKPGDLAAVYWPNSHKVALAVYGDEGGLGEASVRLHYDLGNDPMVKSGGVQRAKNAIGSRVITVVFPGSSTNPTVNSDKWIAQIRSDGGQALKDWGGEGFLKSCH
ncbi:glycoside hydrolase family 75 protein [Mesorhizobium sp. M0478]|uniref:glycoside hydrolase family 75 protein n=1 Tax=Mesorhizobium sp. M0478 TaxID=2956947 RepID=UPI0033385038